MEAKVSRKIEVGSLFICCQCLLFIFSLYFKKDINLVFNIIFIGLLFISIIMINDKLLLLMTIGVSTTYGFFISELNLPQLLQYLPDGFALIILIKIVNVVLRKKKKINNYILKYIIIIFACQLISFYLNSYSIFAFIWGIRNLYRFFIILIGFQYLDIKLNYSKLIKYLNIFIGVQFLLVIFQAVKKSDIDNISGFFGYSGTGLMLIFFMFLCSFYLSNYLHNKISGLKLLVFLGIIFIQLILGSVKAAFFYIPILICIMVILSINVVGNYSKNIKNIIKFCAIIVILTTIFITFYLKMYSDFKDMKQLYSFSYVSKSLYGSYNSDNATINRISGIAVINKFIFNNDFKRLVGVGLGNASPNRYELLQGSYYKQYYYLNYSWFFIPYYLLENGFLGISLFIIILIIMLFKSLDIYKKSKCEDEKLFIFAYQGCVLAVLMTLIYNSGIYTPQVGYLFWALSGIAIKISNRYKLLQAG